MGLITDYLTSDNRPLTGEEINDARRVYQDTIRWELVLVADDLGYDNRPWTEPAGGAMNLFIIHLGKQGYATTIDPSMRARLIHELCHVWQGMHHVFAWSYVVDSAIAQATSGKAAYKYTAGDLWGEYNAEQQAHIVQDWYTGGLKPSSPLYRYIVGNIRHPISSWFGETLIQVGEGLAAVKGWTVF